MIARGRALIMPVIVLTMYRVMMTPCGAADLRGRAPVKKFPVSIDIKGKTFIDEWDRLELSPDGTSVLMVAMLQKERKDGFDYSRYVLVNDRLYGPYAHARGAFFGAHRFFVSYERGKSMYKRCVQNKCTVYPAFACVSLIPPIGKLLEYDFVKRIADPPEQRGFLVDGGNIASSNPWFSQSGFVANSDGSLYAFKYGEGYKRTIYFVRVNDTAYGPFDRASKPALSRNGATYAFSYSDEKRRSVRVNGTVHGPFEGHVPDEVSAPVVSADGAHVGFAHGAGANNPYRFFVRVDANTYGPFSKVGEPGSHRKGPWLRFNDAGTVFAFLYRMSREDGSEMGGVRTADRDYGPYKHAVNLRVSPAGDTVAFRYAMRGDRDTERVMVNGASYGPFQPHAFGYFPHANAPVVSKNGKQFLLSFRENDRDIVQMGARRLGSFYRLTSVPVLSADGARVAFAYKDEFHFVHADGRRYGPYLEAGDIVFGPRGAHLAFTYTAKSGQTYLRVNETEYGPFDYREQHVDRRSLLTVGFAPDDGRYCIRAVRFDPDPARPGMRLRNYYLHTKEAGYGPYQYAAYRFDERGRLIIAYLKDGFVHIEEI